MNDPVDIIRCICDDAEGNKLTRIASTLGCDVRDVEISDQGLNSLVELRKLCWEAATELGRLRNLCGRFYEVMTRLHHGRMPDEVQRVVDEAGEVSARQAQGGKAMKCMHEVAERHKRICEEPGEPETCPICLMEINTMLAAKVAALKLEVDLLKEFGKRALKDRIDCPKCGAKGMYFVSVQMCGLCDTGNA